MVGWGRPNQSGISSSLLGRGLKDAAAAEATEAAARLSEVSTKAERGERTEDRREEEEGGRTEGGQEVVDRKDKEVRDINEIKI